jgi:hypothetical protein
VGLVFVAASSVLTTATVTTPTASAGEPCVTKREYRQVRNGMTKARVHRIFDTSGSVLFSNPGVQMNEAREYRTCRAFRRTAGRTVQIQYNNYATNGGPLRVVFKQTY